MIRHDDGTYHFVCVSCGAQGLLTLPTPPPGQPFACPEGCGTQYAESLLEPGVWVVAPVALTTEKEA